MKNLIKNGNDVDNETWKKDFGMFLISPTTKDEGYNDVKDHLNNFFNSFNEIGIMIDKNYRVLLYNKAANTFLRSFFNEEAKIGGCFIDYCSTEFQDFFIENFRLAFSGKEVLNKEIQKCCPGNSVSCWKMSFMPVVNRQGITYAVTFIAEDVTEVMKREKKMLDQYTRLRKIAWKESHVLRKPLANLKGLAVLLKENPSDKFTLEYLLQELEKLDEVIWEIVQEAYGDNI